MDKKICRVFFAPKYLNLKGTWNVGNMRRWWWRKGRRRNRGERGKFLMGSPDGGGRNGGSRRGMKTVGQAVGLAGRGGRWAGRRVGEGRVCVTGREVCVVTGRGRRRRRRQGL